MKTSRRRFHSAALGAAAASLPLVSSQARAAAPPSPSSPARNPRYAKLDEILRRPVLKKNLFSSPVIIESLELLRLNNSFLCRVRSRDGAEGISVAHSTMNTLFPIFLRNLQPFFPGKDARELDLILTELDAVDGEGASRVDAIPPLSDQIVARHGDTWQLGRHRIRCGDATTREDVEVRSRC